MNLGLHKCSEMRADWQLGLHRGALWLNVLAHRDVSDPTKDGLTVRVRPAQAHRAACREHLPDLEIAVRGAQRHGLDRGEVPAGVGLELDLHLLAPVGMA